MLYGDRFSNLALEPVSGIQFRKRRSLASPKGRLILLHGVGSNESNLMSVAMSLPNDLEILLLRGPLQTSYSGFAWYLVELTSEGSSFRYEQAEAARYLLKQFVESLSELPTVVAGFSQGGIMSSSLGVTEPQLLAGFAILSGRILHEIDQQVAPLGNLKSISAFIAHGRLDDILALDYAVDASARLDRIGIKYERHFYDMAHEIIAEERADFSSWLSNLLSLKG